MVSQQLPSYCNISHLCELLGDGFLACRSVCVFFTINHNALCLFRLTSCGTFAHGIAFSRHCLMASAAYPCFLSFLFGWSASCCHIPWHCGSSRCCRKHIRIPVSTSQECVHLAFLTITFFLCNFIALSSNVITHCCQRQRVPHPFGLACSFISCRGECKHENCIIHASRFMTFVPAWVMAGQTNVREMQTACHFLCQSNVFI